MRTWPALVVSRLQVSVVGADFSRLELLQSALLDHHIAAIDETNADAWRVYFQTNGGRDAALTALQSQFPNLTFEALDVPDEDWAARSQASLRAIQVGDIVVAPPWDVPDPSRLKSAPTTEEGVGAGFSQLVTIIIQPSMGFGTGHHATTRLCLAALQQLDLHGTRVLDVGTGSGVLGIAASRLGATTVVAIDDDPDAIDSARENLVLNPGVKVELQTTDLRSASLTPFDVVIANLTGGLLVQVAARLTDLCGPAGQLVLSGFMLHEEPDVRAAYSSLRVRTRSQEDEWLCVTLAQ